jgi:hypothetical protein
MTDQASSVFRPEALSRHGAGHQTGEPLCDVPPRLLVHLWIYAGLLGAGLIAVVLWLNTLVR